eukprot:UN10347
MHLPHHHHNRPLSSSFSTTQQQQQQQQRGQNGNTNGNNTNTTTTPTPPPSPAQQRLESLDVFRGLVILLMVFCNTGGGGLYIWITHYGMASFSQQI